MLDKLSIPKILKKHDETDAEFIERIKRMHSPSGQISEIYERYNPGEAFEKGVQSASKIKGGEIKMRIGGTELITKENINTQWKESCIDYVNSKIKNAVSNQWSEVYLEKDHMFPELIKELKSNFNIINENKDMIIISWR